MKSNNNIYRIIKDGNGTYQIQSRHVYPQYLACHNPYTPWITDYGPTRFLCWARKYKQEQEAKEVISE